MTEAELLAEEIRAEQEATMRDDLVRRLAAVAPDDCRATFLTWAAQNYSSVDNWRSPAVLFYETLCSKGYFVDFAWPSTHVAALEVACRHSGVDWVDLGSTCLVWAKTQAQGTAFHQYYRTLCDA